MRPSWTAWIVPGLLVLSGIHSIYLGFRISELEQHLAAMGRSGGAKGAATSADSGRASARAAVANAAEPTVEARIDTIEDDLTHMQEEYADLDQKLAGPGGKVNESQILDIVTRAQSRVRDRQLEFHGTQWRNMRTAMFSDFATKNHLEHWQSEQLQRVLDEEIDEAVAILTRPENAENPELLATEWQRRLDETDAEAMRVLQGPAAEAWVGARMFERQLLWPWLPSLQPKTLGSTN
jgi:hypothetical protein